MQAFQDAVGGLLRSTRNIQNRSGFLRAALLALAVLADPPGHAQTTAGLDCGPFRVVGRFASPQITECSGLVVSRKNPGVLWVHNDSGAAARLFAVKEDGGLLGIYRLAHAGSVDWEDIALGPCSNPGEECLYVGDIGDNRRRRRQIQVYRVEEPSVPLDGPPVRATLVGWERFDCRYPDGSHDAETLLVDPAGGIPYLVTKEPRGSAGVVYRFPGRPDSGRIATLEKVSTLPSRSFLTGGDITQDGSLIMLRDYFSAYGYTRPPQGLLSEAFDSPPYRLPLGVEEQGESLGLSLSGNEIYTASEGMGGAIHKAECAPGRTHGTAPLTSVGRENGIEQRP